jgi:hypothetical protein
VSRVCLSAGLLPPADARGHAKKEFDREGKRPACSLRSAMHGRGMGKFRSYVT